MAQVTENLKLLNVHLSQLPAQLSDRNRHLARALGSLGTAGAQVVCPAVHVLEPTAANLAALVQSAWVNLPIHQLQSLEIQWGTLLFLFVVVVVLVVVGVVVVVVIVNGNLRRTRRGRLLLVVGRRRRRVARARSWWCSVAFAPLHQRRDQFGLFVFGQHVQSSLSTEA